MSQLDEDNMMDQVSQDEGVDESDIDAYIASKYFPPMYEADEGC